MYITCTEHLTFRDRDNYHDESICDSSYIWADTLDELYDKVVEKCLEIHKINFSNKSLDRMKGIENGVFNFDYASSHDNDYYLTFGNIVFDSKEPDEAFINEKGKTSFEELVNGCITKLESFVKSTQETVNNERKKLYEELKAEFEK